MSHNAPLPFSQASENNKHAIIEVLQRHLGGRRSLLEIGGGTGQHATYFANAFPDLIWQSTDIPENVEVLNLRITAAVLPNLPVANSLDVNQSEWHQSTVDCIFTANSLHIMSADSVENFFGGCARHLNSGGLLLVYGPFKYGGKFTTESNARFDVWLKERNLVSGIRDFEWLDQLARIAGLDFIEDNEMPANNQLLVWQNNR